MQKLIKDVKYWVKDDCGWRRDYSDMRNIAIILLGLIYGLFTLFKILLLIVSFPLWITPFIIYTIIKGN